MGIGKEVVDSLSLRLLLVHQEAPKVRLHPKRRQQTRHTFDTGFPNHTNLHTLTSTSVRPTYAVSFLPGEPGQPVETSVSLTGEKDNKNTLFNFIWKTALVERHNAMACSARCEHRTRGLERYLGSGLSRHTSGSVRSGAALW